MLTSLVAVTQHLRLSHNQPALTQRREAIVQRWQDVKASASCARSANLNGKSADALQINWDLFN